MKLKKNLPDYEIITERKVEDGYDLPDDFTMEDEEKMLEDRMHEQNEKLESLGFSPSDDDYVCYILHFFNSVFRDEEVEVATLYDALQWLAIKDGADLVKFENGRIGFVAYYNGHEDAFEIIGKPEIVEPIFLKKVEAGEIEEDEADFDDYISYEDDLRKLVEEL